MQPTALIKNYWRNVLERGEVPLSVYAIVHKQGSTQPVGFVQGWGLSKRWAEAQKKSLCATQPAARVKLVIIDYKGE